MVVKPKPDFPWRRREQKARPRTWWSKLWDSRTVWAGAFALVGAVIAFVLTQGVSSLQNARRMPSELSETYYALLSWYYEDAAWTKTWSSREEGHIDDYHQADVPLKLEVEATRGKVIGEMFNRRVCDLNPMLPPVLVEGEIRRGKLIAYAYAYVGGEKTALYSFSATQSENEPVITIAPLSDPLDLVPPSARLLERFEQERFEDSSSNSNTKRSEHPDLSCLESPIQYLQRQIKGGKRKSSKELEIDREPKNVLE